MSILQAKQEFTTDPANLTVQSTVVAQLQAPMALFLNLLRASLLHAPDTGLMLAAKLGFQSDGAISDLGLHEPMHLYPNLSHAYLLHALDIGLMAATKIRSRSDAALTDHGLHGPMDLCPSLFHVYLLHAPDTGLEVESESAPGEALLDRGQHAPMGCFRTSPRSALMGRGSGTGVRSVIVENLSFLACTTAGPKIVPKLHLLVR